MDEVKRPEGPPARSHGSASLKTSSFFIFSLLTRWVGWLTQGFRWPTNIRTSPPPLSATQLSFAHTAINITSEIIFGTTIFNVAVSWCLFKISVSLILTYFSICYSIILGTHSHQHHQPDHLCHCDIQCWVAVSWYISLWNICKFYLHGLLYHDICLIYL